VLLGTDVESSARRLSRDGPWARRGAIEHDVVKEKSGESNLSESGASALYYITTIRTHCKAHYLGFQKKEKEKLMIQV
jgi:hypothetical protein